MATTKTQAPSIAVGSDFARVLFTDPEKLLSLTDTQRQAFDYFNMGLNIGPTKPRSKEPFVWRRLGGTRIDRNYIPELFDNQSGIFVLTGRLSMGLYILDCETPASADYHQKEFQRRGLAPWVVRSARGKHFWVLSPGGEVANHKDPSGAWEVLGNLRYALCPYSVHPSGVIYEWEYRAGDRPPFIPIEALDWLPLKPALEARHRHEPHAANPLACLSQTTRDFIAEGAPAGTRNRRLFSAACDLAGNGFTFSEARERLSPPARASGLASKEIGTTLRSAFAQARTPAKGDGGGSTQKSQTPRWVRAVSFANAHPWASLEANVQTPGGRRHYRVTSTTARAVFIACCERARRDSSEVFRATTREVAELANVKSDTAYRGLMCLVGAGYLRRCGYSRLGEGLYAFAKKLLQQGDTIPPWFSSSVPILQQIHADVFARGALGATTERVWRLILVEPMRAADIARRLHINRATAGRCLKRLEAFRLAEAGAKRAWAGNSAGPEFLTRIAADLGTLGHAERRKAEHAHERARNVSHAILRAKRRWEKGTSARPPVPEKL